MSEFVPLIFGTVAMLAVFLFFSVSEAQPLLGGAAALR
jgi:hypothetical protein